MSGDTASDVPSADTSTFEPPFRIAVFGKPGDPHLIASILCETLGLTSTDATIHAHYAPGVLPLPLNRAQAERILELICGLGIQGTVVDAATLPSFKNAEAVHHARCLAEGWEIVDYRGSRSALVPWSEIDLIAVGEVPNPPVMQPLAAGHSLLSAAPHYVTPLVEPTVPTGPELWVIACQPTRVYHITHRAMNYESLGAAKTDSATLNFRAFVEQLIQHAGNAWKTHSTQAYLTRKALSHYEFRSSDDLQRQAELTWVMEQQVRQGG